MDFTKGSDTGWSRFNKKKKLKREKREVKWRKTVGRFDRGVFAESTVRDSGDSYSVSSADNRSQDNDRMVLTKLAGISIFVTLSFRTLVILGESVLTSEIDKSGDLKASDKRINNFGVPMEMPSDTNFWPSRGRRDKHSENDICYTSDRSLVFVKGGLRCQPLRTEEDPAGRKGPLGDAEFNPSDEPDNLLLGGYNKMGRDCCKPVREGSRGVLSKKIPDLLDLSPLFGLRPFEELRNERQRHNGFPRVLLYGNTLYWKPESPYGGKRKKEDVFWVARGKKNYFTRK